MTGYPYSEFDGGVCVFLDDADALADLHQRIGRQLVELGRGEVRS